MNDVPPEAREQARRRVAQLLREADWDPESGIVTLRDGNKLECRSLDELTIALIELGETIATSEGPASPGSPVSKAVRGDVLAELARYSAQARAMGWGE